MEEGGKYDGRRGVMERKKKKMEEEREKKRRKRRGEREREREREREFATDGQDVSYSLFARKKIAGSISACSQLGGQLVVPREVTRS